MFTKLQKGFLACIFVLVACLTFGIPAGINIFDIPQLIISRTRLIPTKVLSSNADNQKTFNDLKPYQSMNNYRIEDAPVNLNGQDSLSSLSSKLSSPSSSSSLSFSSKGSVDYYNTKSEPFLKGLKQMGLEPAELHEFKSRYLITPHVYEDIGRSKHGQSNRSYKNTIVRKPQGVRRTKIISYQNLARNSWIRTQSIFSYNRDFKKCPYSECYVDLDGKMSHKADMLWFFCRALKRKDLSRPRLPGQLWAIGCWESPAHWNYSVDKAWRSAFNLTVGYHHSLDINGIHTKMAWRDSDDLLKDEEYLAAAKGKTKTAAWFVSNCGAPSKRLQYVKEMQKYIDVDIFGKCGTKRCPWSEQDECQGLLNTTYKFYLSFENSLCEDYATYKFFGVFHRKHLHVVPVVRGGFDYEKYLPDNVHVNAKNFKSAKDLALYLKELGNDVVRYSKMLKEKDRFVRLEYNVDWCDICEGLHTGEYVGRVILDAWKETHPGVCWSPEDI